MKISRYFVDPLGKHDALIHRRKSPLRAPCFTVGEKKNRRTRRPSNVNKSRRSANCGCTDSCTANRRNNEKGNGIMHGQRPRKRVGERRDDTSQTFAPVRHCARRRVLVFGERKLRGRASGAGSEPRVARAPGNGD